MEPVVCTGLAAATVTNNTVLSDVRPLLALHLAHKALAIALVFKA